MLAIIKTGLTADSSVGFTFLDFLAALGVVIVAVLVAGVRARTPQDPRWRWTGWGAFEILTLFGVSLLVFALLVRW